MSNQAALFNTTRPSVEQVVGLVNYIFDQDSREWDEVNLTAVPALGELVVAHIDEEGGVLTSISKSPDGALNFARHQVVQRCVRMEGQNDGCEANSCLTYSLRGGYLEAENALARSVFSFGDQTNQHLLVPVAVTHLMPVALGHPERDALSVYSFVADDRLAPFEEHLFSLPLLLALQQTQRERIAIGRAPLWSRGASIARAV